MYGCMQGIKGGCSWTWTQNYRFVDIFLVLSTPTIMTSAIYTIMDDNTGKYATGPQVQGKSVEWKEENGAETQDVRCMRQFEHEQSS